MINKFKQHLTVAIAAINILVLSPLVSQAQVSPLVPVVSAPVSNTPALLCYDFNRSLKTGDKGEAVRLLQYFLISGEQAAIDSGEYGAFGPATLAAVVAFQTKYAGDIIAHMPHQQATGTVG